ncbi:hypothetical protein H2200_007785 [Cladophialophora chaetospira]|uniref:Cytochrome P450 n=1 Tax=Cladophialophora chaetospira TaxID=386627 RepID=A0AA39CGT3_9EURO|nr:hypothetical protein H2200_007785 [Cladophialophora chaetospira]
MTAFTVSLPLQSFPISYALWILPILYVVSTVFYRVFFHPLASYPGPFFAKFTELYPMLAMVKRNRIVWQYEMLQKYGSPVRVATNELFFSDMKSWSDIYGQSSSPCQKEKVFYDMFTVTGATSVLNERDKVQHSRLRRLLSHGFSLKALLQEQPLVQKKVDEYINIVIAPAAEKGQTVDIYTKLIEHYLDITSYLSFGESFDCVSGKALVTQHDMDQFMIVVPTQSFFPALRHFPIKSIQEAYRGLGKLIDFSRTRVRAFQSKLEKEGDQFAKGTFLRNLVDARDEETGGSKLTFEELVENTIIFLVAGSDTTAVTTTYVIWECGRKPEVRKKLVDEIRAAFPDPTVMPTYEETSKLPYLNAVIEEALRVWGPLSAGFPRVSPGRIIGEHYIPQGVVVSTSAYATARDPTVFPNPHVFQPERWLKATPEMRNMSRPFSYGPRNCIGKHLADINMNITLARLYQLYDIENDPSMTEEMMAPNDRGVTSPVGSKLLVRPRRAGALVP